MSELIHWFRKPDSIRQKVDHQLKGTFHPSTVGGPATIMALMNDAQNHNLPALLSVLERLTEEELVQLNHVIVARLRLMQQIRSHDQMMNFRIGQAVHFTTDTGQVIRGIIKSHNRKSVTVLSDAQVAWRVAPALLHAD
jgi:hypothetical protein